jgi:hypothetical protein
MRISGDSSSYQSPEALAVALSAEAAAAAREMAVLKKQQDVSRNVGQALVALIDGASSGNGRINVYA